MKRIIIILTIFILILPGILGNPISNKEDRIKNIETQDEFTSPIILKFLEKIPNVNTIRDIVLKRFTTNVFDDFSFLPETIELKDDAFHGSDNLHFMEWWYFDANFNNNYSIQISIHVFSILTKGFITANIDIYKDGNILVSEKEFYDFENFNASTEIPLIILDNRRVMHGYIDSNSSNWIYDLSLKIGDVSINLTFYGCSTGWKGTTPVSAWGVILPKATVKGTIDIEDVDHFLVDGIGYHDHNWNVTVFSGINFGWLWGKLNTDTFIVTWSNILSTWFNDQPLLVINLEDKGFIGIQSKDIEFIVKKIKLVDWFIVPYVFEINIETRDFSMKLNIKTLNTHYISILGIINYWRYHTKCQGSIRFHSKVENIDKTDMAEFIRFRFY